jgi:hypothetical protein
MTYTTYDTVPAYEAPVWHVDEQGRHNGLDNRDNTKWSGKEPPPPIGTEVVVTMWNPTGLGVVTGYFTEGGWLGLLVSMYTAPEWFTKRNPHNMKAHVFGPEWRRAITEGTLNEIDIAALTSYAAEHGRKWKEALREDWMKARAEPGRYWADRGRVLHRLRNNPDFGPRGLEKFRLNQERKIA